VFLEFATPQNSLDRPLGAIVAAIGIHGLCVTSQKQR